ATSCGGQNFAAGATRQQWHCQQPAWRGSLFYHILPFMEQENAYNRIINRSWGTSANNIVIKTFIAPLDPTAPTSGIVSSRSIISYDANSYGFGPEPAGPGSAYQESVTSLPKITASDGTSNTIAFGERFARCQVTNPDATV